MNRRPFAAFLAGLCLAGAVRVQGQQANVNLDWGGEGRPLDRTFSGIRPNAQGKILLSFVPKKGMAFVNAIEVVEESQ